MPDLFDGFYRNRSVFLTGHTGFKGRWLACWLEMLGADVTGYALPPLFPPLDTPLRKPNLKREYLEDIRNFDIVAEAVCDSMPDIVVHLAAQPIVRKSYVDPIETLTTNVIGTANLLEACRRCPTVRAILVVTSDKCYQNREWDWGYREIDPLGGHDPYSASKACAELVAGCFRDSFSETASLATCRTGNVIGGGDWGEDRLIPDMIRAALNRETTMIRNPTATRPWLHVLDPLRGYLLLGKKLLEESNHDRYARPWNFGPDADANLSVHDLVKLVAKLWDRVEYDLTTDPMPHENRFLMLDSARARKQLGWKPRWNIVEATRRTMEWYKNYSENGADLTERQILGYTTEVRQCQESCHG